MADTPARAARVERMRTQLMDAAEAIYAAEGSVALTNRRIAADADTTTQSIYTYYGSRDALIDAMYRRAVDGAGDLLDTALGAAPPADDRTEEAIFEVFKDLARAYREYCLTYPGRFRLIRAASHDPAAPPEAAGLRERLVSALITFGRSGGGWQEPTYEGRVRLTLSAVHGFIIAELESFITADDDADRLFDELVHRCLIPYEQLPYT